VLKRNLVAVASAHLKGSLAWARRPEAALDLRARYGSAAIMASVKHSPESRTNLKEKETQDCGVLTSCLHGRVNSIVEQN
jgi:hypothetical protein